MLRTALLGLVILLGVGALSAMELRAPRHSAVAAVQPLAEPNADTNSHGVLAKADRLEVIAPSSERPTEAVSVDERIVLPEDVSIDSSEPPRPIARRRHDTKKAATAARPKPKPKATVIKRTAIFQRSKPATGTEPCRLMAFGGLRKALNSAACEI
ncbi:hypothetical protein [Bradyrhizobium sp. WSM3983]|uniref:hypothetical protein n=1 Tax=Bradyrhizobium sp. WSM3983 TaxID=1038867 RepID=UPI000486B238|nr:hypothetical protein [Bradyrhizobium sp. WSM3983]